MSSSTEIVTPGPRPCCLERLNYDILEIIYGYLRPARGLRPLALTSRWVRASCKPVLFRRAIVRPDLVTEEHFLPSYLWLYVHSLTFAGRWVYPTPPRSYYRPISLSNVLPRIPHLSRVSIRDGAEDGVPWLAIDEILALPCLRVFEVQGTLNYWNRRPDDQSHQALASPPPPLTTYRHSLRDFRERPRRLPSDADTIACVVSYGHVQQSLEYLTLASEVAPVATLGAVCWPRLKVLSLRGEMENTKNLIRLFEHMPALEELSLQLARATGTGSALVFCPAEWSGQFPWPRLRRLVVSYPDPDDLLYPLLASASALQCLDLRCWPRHYIHLSLDDRIHMTQLRWRSPILKSSELLRLLSQCRSHSLSELAIEYTEDEEDLELLRHIPLFFPNLEILFVHRYRKSGNENVPIRAIGQALASSSRLRVVYAHLDLYGTPEPWVNLYNRRSDKLAHHLRSLVESARELAQVLGTSVQAVCLLHREVHLNIWAPFRIVRTDDSVDASPEAPSDAVYIGDLELIARDEPGPPHTYREWGVDPRTARIP
ncbi:hypothetical protein FKP32DRAFT_1594317 [Trametes sanguinea]|nr:hypothetical protein FKP32DRAFT_1594317 [Trametes sanguinea]